MQAPSTIPDTSSQTFGLIGSAPSDTRSQGKWKEEPAENHSGADETSKEQTTKPQLLERLVLHEDREHHRDAGRKDHHRQKVTSHLRLLSTERHVVGVETDQHVKQSGHDHEGVAIFERLGHDTPLAKTDKTGY